MSLATRRRRALVLVAVAASQGWTASLLSLPALEHHLVGLGVLVNVYRQAESIAKVSSHADVFESMWANQPVRFELVSRDCQPPLRFSLSLSLSLSLFFSLSLSLSLSPYLSLSLSLRLTTHRYAHRQLRKLETVLEDTV